MRNNRNSMKRMYFTATLSKHSSRHRHSVSRKRTALRHMIKLTNFLNHQRRSDKAIIIYEMAIPTFDALFGPRDATFRRGALRLARLYRQNGRPSEAQHMLSRATATERRTSLSSLLNVLKDDNRSRISAGEPALPRSALESQIRY